MDKKLFGLAFILLTSLSATGHEKYPIHHEKDSQQKFEIQVTRSFFADIDFAFSEYEKAMYETHDEKSEKLFRRRIIHDLNRMMHQGTLSQENVDQAKQIATAIKAMNLKVRLDNYYQKEKEINYDKVLRLGNLPNEILEYIFLNLPIRDLFTLLSVNKNFNCLLFSMPLDIDLSYSSNMDDNMLDQIVSLFPNLRSLCLGPNKNPSFAQQDNPLAVRRGILSDISPCAHLLNPSRLELKCLNIQDITPLTRIFSLTYLDLSNNFIQDIKPLAQLTNLTHLNLANNPVLDRTPVEFLPNIIELKWDDENLLGESEVNLIGVREGNWMNLIRETEEDLVGESDLHRQISSFMNIFNTHVQNQSQIIIQTPVFNNLSALLDHVKNS